MKSSARTIFVMSLVAAGAYFAFGMQPAISGNLTKTAPEDRSGAGAPAATNSSSTSDSAPAGAAGMKIHIDPQTGALTKEAPPTAPLVLSPAEQNTFSTSHQGLVEVPSPVPGGGVIVDLQGRFQHPLFATIDATGKVTIRHLDPTPGRGEPK